MLPSLSSCVLLLAAVLAADTEQAVLSGATRPSLRDKRLVQLSQDPLNVQWMSFEDRFALKNDDGFYKDVTNFPEDQRVAWATSASSVTQRTYSPPRNSTLAHSIIKTIDTAHPKKHLRKLTNLFTRWCETETGLQTSLYLYDILKGYVKNAPSVHGRTLELHTHFHEFKQFSLVLRIAGPETADTDPVSITGGHIDSASIIDPLGRAPGADDDGSGTVSMLETARVLLASHYVPSPHHAVEIHFYAGEEIGLIGSADIAAQYKARGVEVVAMMQQDMVAFVVDKDNEHIGITVSRGKALGEFNKKLVDVYLSIPWIEEVTYPWGASDSASWGDLGYPSSDALEGTWAETRSHKVHTVNDNMEHEEYSFEHLKEAVKLAVAFHVELGGEAEV